MEVMVQDPMVHDPCARILVVEDDKNLRDSLCEALEWEGFATVSAEHGEAALRYLRAGERPCVILLDLMMPVMDGWSFRREMMNDQALSDIPVVIMSAARLDRGPPVEVNEVLVKPLQMDTVVEAIQRHCQAHLPGGEPLS